MEKPHEILIADRNPHIREFLRRELSGFGYSVRLAKSGRELLDQLRRQEQVSLLIVDPDFPGADTSGIFKEIIKQVPRLPVVLFSARGTENLAEPCKGNVYFLEKNGAGVERLKEIIPKILDRST